MKQFMQLFISESKTSKDVFDFLLPKSMKEYDSWVETTLKDMKQDELLAIKTALISTKSSNSKLQDIVKMVSTLITVNAGYTISFKDPMGNKKSFFVKNTGGTINTNINSNFAWSVKNKAEIPAPKGYTQESEYLKKIIIDAYKNSSSADEFKNNFSKKLYFGSVTITELN